MYMVDPDAFSGLAGENAVPSVAATTGGGVSLGSVTRGADDGTGVHVVSGLLPPANQDNLHPFGLLDYTTSFLGYLVFTSALGFTQERQLADGTVRTFGRGDEWSAEPPATPISAAGSRESDSSVVTAGQLHRIDVTLADLDGADGAEVYDTIPDGWELADVTDDARETDESGQIRLVETDDDGNVVDETFDADDANQDGASVEFTYFLRAPDGADSTGPYSVGPAEVVADETATFAGQSDVIVVGVDV